jgi:hypothetical protein
VGGEALILSGYVDRIFVRDDFTTETETIHHRDTEDTEKNTEKNRMGKHSVFSVSMW